MQNSDRNGLMDQINKEELIDKFIYELPILRARIDMTQDEISEIAGLSRVSRWKESNPKESGVHKKMPALQIGM